MGVEVFAKHLISFNGRTELPELCTFLATHPKEEPLFILGGGSNILFTQNFEGTILLVQTKGITIEPAASDSNTFIVKVEAGENWHSLVRSLTEQGYYGLENLSLIPGCVGACPIQNIGAYGVEVKDLISEVEVLNLSTLQIEYLSNADCDFGYRDSIFKREAKGKYLILSVSFLLKNTPSLHIDYGDIQKVLADEGILSPTPLDVSNAVITIRNSKLPNPAELGNCGSFFKNPSIPLSQFNELKTIFPEIKGFPNADGSIKVPAGWLIEQAGLKGLHRGTHGVHAKQALVLVNYANATGTEINSLADDVRQVVFEKFGIALEKEVNII